MLCWLKLFIRFKHVRSQDIYVYVQCKGVYSKMWLQFQFKFNFILANFVQNQQNSVHWLFIESFFIVHFLQLCFMHSTWNFFQQLLIIYRDIISHDNLLQSSLYHPPFVFLKLLEVIKFSKSKSLIHKILAAGHNIVSDVGISRYTKQIYVNKNNFQFLKCEQVREATTDTCDNIADVDIKLSVHWYFTQKVSC